MTAITKTDKYGSEASWTMTQNTVTVCSLSGLKAGTKHNVETECCFDKNQSIELECMDAYEDGWSWQTDDAGITFDGKKYCSGSFSEELKTITFSGMNFINMFCYVNNESL